MEPIGADVRVVGVGGAGANAVRRMIERDGQAERSARFIVANTDGQSLHRHPASHRLLLGARSTGGLGAGGRPSVGFAAAQESLPEIAEALSGADLVFITAGLGGGTGSGAAPLFAHLAREAGALVIGVVSTPFGFEGSHRRAAASQAIDHLSEQVDSLLVVDNDRLLALDDMDATVGAAFSTADAVLSDAVGGIGDLVLSPGLINLDFADVCAVLRDGGRAVMGVGSARGADRASRAVEAAGRSPLLDDDSIEGARGVLLSFTVDERVGLNAIHRAAARIQASVDDDAEILFGVAVDPSFEDEVRVTLVAAGLDEAQERPPARADHDATLNEVSGLVHHGVPMRSRRSR